MPPVVIPSYLAARPLAGGTFRRPAYLRRRVWRTARVNDLPVQTLYCGTREVNTFAFDFSSEAALQSGQALVIDPVPTVVFSGDETVPTGFPEVSEADFFDSDGTRVKAGTAVLIKAGPVPAGEYTASCLVETDGGEVLEVVGKLVSKATPGT